MAKRATQGSPALLRGAPLGRERRAAAWLGRDWKVALPFVLPLVIIMAGLIFWPFINAILLSFTTRNIITRTDQFVGLRNYQLLWRDSEFRSAVGNTILFTAASIGQMRRFSIPASVIWVTAALRRFFNSMRSACASCVTGVVRR